MPLNKSKGNMYPFITHTWNPIKGACPHDCSYCYMKKSYKRFGKTPAPLHLDNREIKTNLGKNNFIFVGSSCDIWANSVSGIWQSEIIEHINTFNDNRYFFQTKNPSCFVALSDYFNSSRDTLCVTLESNRTDRKIMCNSPSIYDRIIYSHVLVQKGFNLMIDSGV